MFQTQGTCYHTGFVPIFSTPATPPVQPDHSVRYHVIDLERVIATLTSERASLVGDGQTIGLVPRALTRMNQFNDLLHEIEAKKEAKKRVASAKPPVVRL